MEIIGRELREDPWTNCGSPVEVSMAGWEQQMTVETLLGSPSG